MGRCSVINALINNFSLVNHRIYREIPPISRDAKGYEQGGIMDDLQRLNHTKWDCKFHVMWIPNNRRKIFSSNCARQVQQRGFINTVINYRTRLLFRHFDRKGDVMDASPPPSERRAKGDRRPPTSKIMAHSRPPVSLRGDQSD